MYVCLQPFCDLSDPLKRSEGHLYTDETETSTATKKKRRAAAVREGSSQEGSSLKVTPIMCDGAEFNQREEQVDGGWS